MDWMMAQRAILLLKERTVDWKRCCFLIWKNPSDWDPGLQKPSIFSERVVIPLILWVMRTCSNVNIFRFFFFFFICIFHHHWNRITSEWPHDFDDFSFARHEFVQEHKQGQTIRAIKENCWKCPSDTVDLIYCFIWWINEKWDNNRTKTKKNLTTGNYVKSTIKSLGLSKWAKLKEHGQLIQSRRFTVLTECYAMALWHWWWREEK